MFVIVVGGGKVGYHLASALLRAGREVLLLEKDAARAERIQEELGEIVRRGDGCEMRTMEEVGFERADVVAAVTGDDEDNLVICQMARRYFQVPRVVGRVNNPKNEQIFHLLGVEETINSTRIIQSLIEQEVESGEVVPLTTLSKGEVEIVEARITETSPAAGRTLKEVPLPGECLIAAILREGHILQPSLTTQIASGDSVIVLCRPEEEPDVRRVLEGRPRA
jgi:trk system potassium uptake protein TrkA